MKLTNLILEQKSISGHHYLFDIKLNQKDLNIYAYIPLKSDHPSHIIVNFILAELKRYIKCNSDEFDFLCNKFSFYNRLIDRGYDRNFLNQQFGKISYNSRSDLLSLPVHLPPLQEGSEDEARAKISQATISTERSS